MALRPVSIGEAFKRKYPEQIALAVSVDAAGRPDVITLGWVMPTSNVPPMVAISVGHTRYSHELIAKSGEFVLVFPSAAQAEACLICGTKSGRDTDKIAAAALRTAPAKVIRTPLIEGAVANFECRVTGRLVTGDHTIFAAEVLAAHVDDAAGERVYNFAGRFVAAAPRK